MRTLTSQLATEASFQPLMDYVIAATGLVYYEQRSGEFASHVAHRLTASSTPDCRTYLALLQCGQAGQQELDRLITLMTIGETHFFRHRELFSAIEHTLIPDLITRKRNSRRLRVWSAGCSTGAEAYSLSILLRDRFAEQLSNWDVEILGTDINRDFLARAAAGQFDEWALRSLSVDERSTCFTRRENRWLLNPQFQSNVRFEYHNLATAPLPLPRGGGGGFDLILCRNVMIYFSLETVRHSVEKFHAALAPGGWLLVGHAEHNVEWFRQFRTVMSHGAVLYQKREAEAAVAQAITNPQAKLALSPALPSGVPAANNPVAAPSITVRAPVEQREATAAGSSLNLRLQEVRTLADQGELHAALECCEQALTTDEGNPLFHFFHGLLLHQLGEQSAAEQSLRRATYLDRNCLLAHYYLGLLWQQQGRVPRAVNAFRNVARLLLGLPLHVSIPHADELTVGDLTHLTAAHLAALEAR